MLLFLRKKSNQKSRRQKITSLLPDAAMCIFSTTVTSTLEILFLELICSLNLKNNKDEKL